MAETLIEVQGLHAGYKGHAVIEDIDLSLNPNEVLCLIGHNGAGKSTLLKCMFGLLPRMQGNVRYGGGLTHEQVALVPEGKGVFPSLTVMENFDLGLDAARIRGAERAARVDWVLGILPQIREFLHRRAGTLSGGQAQMVSIGRALLKRPRVLIMDEPSIGLAPKLFQDLLGPIRALQQAEGLTILLVEQNVREALKVSDRVAVMKQGRMVWHGTPSELSNDRLMELY
jgi:branched-chain amino acid transport system ATP-binding protein